MNVIKTSLLTLALISTPLVGFDTGFVPRANACTKLLAFGSAIFTFLILPDLIGTPIPKVSLEECSNVLVELHKKYPDCSLPCIRASDKYVLKTGDWENFEKPLG